MNPHIETLKALRDDWQARHAFGKGEFAALTAAIADMESKPKLIAALKNLERDYVATLEAGYDRITQLGGDCDSVSRMESASTPLRETREILAAMKGSE